MQDESSSTIIIIPHHPLCDSSYYIVCVSCFLEERRRLRWPLPGSRYVESFNKAISTATIPHMPSYTRVKQFSQPLEVETSEMIVMKPKTYQATKATMHRALAPPPDKNAR